jgi:Fic family protein
MSTFAFRKLVQRIREELEAAPDLRMTVREAASFWGLDLATCLRVLTELREIGVVARDADCHYYPATV